MMSCCVVVLHCVVCVVCVVVLFFLHYRWISTVNEEKGKDLLKKKVLLAGILQHEACKYDQVDILLDLLNLASAYRDSGV